MSNNPEENPNSYNGWTNYETWCINLWLTDNPTDYHYLTHLSNNPRLSDYDKANQLRSDIEETIPDTLTGLFRDLLLSSISECNFYEIIQSNKDEDEPDDDESEPEEDQEV
jgi:hypothetical protein